MSSMEKQSTATMAPVRVSTKSRTVYRGRAILWPKRYAATHREPGDQRGYQVPPDVVHELVVKHPQGHVHLEEDQRLVVTGSAMIALPLASHRTS